MKIIGVAGVSLQFSGDSSHNKKLRIVKHQADGTEQWGMELSFATAKSLKKLINEAHPKNWWR